eukprot:TRINITY_DN6971_c0_g1_i1.p1 TRINITY_DN6971_c0_g1~~TRINITY_DN6971_c0_g1_i1.p1  ORF type:complete len:268 (-),score=46.83 TRINITY_DN6971_c0_g1_i1:820-1623(-)
MFVSALRATRTQRPYVRACSSVPPDSLNKFHFDTPNYGFWSQGYQIKNYLLKDFEVSYMPLLTPFLGGLWKRHIPSIAEMPKEAEFAYMSMAERFADGKIDSMATNTSPLVGTLLKSWESHCKEHNLHWKLEVKEVLNSVGLRCALLAEPTSLEEALQVNHSHIFRELRKAYQNPTGELHAVYWVHFAVNEEWKLYDSKNKLVFTSPELHANHHLWKFSTTIPLSNEKAPLEWKVVDMDNQVRTRLQKLHPQGTGNLSDVELWEALV